MSTLGISSQDRSAGKLFYGPDRGRVRGADRLNERIEVDVLKRSFAVWQRQRHGHDRNRTTVASWVRPNPATATVNESDRYCREVRTGAASPEGDDSRPGRELHVITREIRLL